MAGQAVSSVVHRGGGDGPDGRSPAGLVWGRHTSSQQTRVRAVTSREGGDWIELRVEEERCRKGIIRQLGDAHLQPRNRQRAAAG